MRLMQQEGCETQTRFNVNVYQNGELIEKCLGYGEHSGSYMGQDPCTITIDRNVMEEVKVDSDKPDASKAEIKVRKQVKLTEKDFHSFGSEMNMVEFQKDDLMFILRYMPNTDYYESEYKLGEEFTKHNNEQLQKLTEAKQGSLRQA